MEPTKPIPTPLFEHWRRVRFKAVHTIGFLVVCCGIAFAWRQMSRPLTFPGEVEVVQANVTSPEPGVLTNLSVTSFQPVKAGDLLCEVITTDPHSLNNRLEAVRDRMRLTELEMGPILGRQRNALEYEQLTITCARLKAELALTQVNYLEASNDFFRLKQSGSDQPPSALAQAKARYQALKAELDEKAKLVEASQQGLERLAFMTNSPGVLQTNDPLRQALRLEEEKIKTFTEKLKPVQLRAPINGVVTAVHRQPGEQVLAGQPILTLTAQESQRIVGFLPPSFPLTPEPGMDVEVRTRSRHKKIGSARILGLGPNWESVTNVLAANRFPLTQPLGRPVSISLPAGSKLLPGEPLEITLSR